MKIRNDQTGEIRTIGRKSHSFSRDAIFSRPLDGGVRILHTVIRKVEKHAGIEKILNSQGWTVIHEKQEKQKKTKKQEEPTKGKTS